jgi:hypothetical protein
MVVNTSFDLMMATILWGGHDMDGTGSGGTMDLDGWHADPFGSHQERFFKDGEPTPLVRDNGVGSYDEPPASFGASVPRQLDPLTRDGEEIRRERPPTRNVKDGGPRAEVPVVIHRKGELFGGPDAMSFSQTLSASGQLIPIHGEIRQRPFDRACRKCRGTSFAVQSDKRLRCLGGSYQPRDVVPPWAPGNGTGVGIPLGPMVWVPCNATYEWVDLAKQLPLQ